MSRTRTVSLPDELDSAVEALIARAGASRSEVYQRALASFVKRESPDPVTEQIDRLIARDGVGVEPSIIPLRELVESGEWEW